MSVSYSDRLLYERNWQRLLIFGLFTTLSLLVLTTTFWFFYRDSCPSVASWKYCKFSRHFGERALAVMVLAAIYGVARPAQIQAILDYVPQRRQQVKLLALGAVALLVAAGPARVVGADATGPVLLTALGLWTLGVIGAVVVALALLAPWQIWRQVLRAVGVLVLPLALIALSLPELGDLLFPLWHIEAIRDATFAAVVWTSDLIGLRLQQGDDFVLGQDSFFVQVGQSCSGIEGFVLISVFLTGYGALFWRQLSVGRVLLILPLGIALSWVLNVGRISGLIWLGVNVSPTLAVEGFHSHAGWLLFSILALGLIAVVHLVPWFHNHRLRQAPRAAPAGTPLPPVLQDWNVVRILPFGVFMLSALLVSTFVQQPVLAYPLRLLMMAVVLWLFRAPLMALPWRLNGLAFSAGLAIGVVWLITARTEADAASATALAGLGGGVLALWIVARIMGTALAVPIIEELFFRSYLLERLKARNSTIHMCWAVAVSTLCFALLHDRWLAAGLAGVVFATLTLRPGGRITDAILAHMIANATIAAAALWQQNWGLI